jgi:hypothetical protein
MPLLRPGLPPVYHDGEQRPPMSINTRRPTGELPTEVKGQVLPPGTTVSTAANPGVSTRSANPVDLQAPHVFPSSEAPPPQIKQPTASPTPQSPPDHQDGHGNKHWRKKQHRLEQERLAAASATGQNAGGDPLLK